MLKNIFQIFLYGSLLLLVNGCASTLIPLTNDTKIENEKVIGKSIVINSAFTFKPRLYSVTYPSGKYNPVFEDDNGVYFKAQNQIIGKTMAGGRVFEGGLYVSKANKASIQSYINESGAIYVFEIPVPFESRFIDE